MKQYIVDSFTDQLFSGNPAAVLPCLEMPSRQLMQAIALENNYSETAFVVKRAYGHYDLKWFTPNCEVDLCGHATLATSYVIHRYVDIGINEMHFNTLSGELIVYAIVDNYIMSFPIGRYQPIALTNSILYATGNLAKQAYFDGDGGNMIVVISSEEDLALFQPDYESIKRLEGQGLIITAPSKTYDFVSRCFYPKQGIPEDPVTGSAHTYLAPLWAEKTQKTSMIAKQLSHRGGILKVSLQENRVLISGEATLFMEGEIPFEL